MWQYGIGYERRQRLNDTDQHAAEHSAHKVTDTSQHCCSKGNQTKLETNKEKGTAILQTINETGRPSKRSTYEEGDRNDTVDVHAHERSRFTVLRHCTHCTPYTRAAHHPLEANHQHERNDEHEYIDTTNRHWTQIIGNLGENLWNGDEAETLPERAKIF